jgi:hypothetical protein
METAEQEIKKIKQDIDKALDHIDLAQFVTLKEIESEISRVETAFQSLLLLGILSRIMHLKDDFAAQLFIPAVTNWKNFLPHNELGGLTPFEHREKFPPGPYEAQFLSELMDEYQTILGSRKENEQIDIETDFAEFQKHYFERIPLEQPFATKNNGILMTSREIIIEERRVNNHPHDSLDKIGAEVFAENSADNLGDCIARIDDEFREAVQELALMQSGARARSKKRVAEFKELFERNEQYHRCGPQPHNFYFNYAMILLLEDDVSRSVSLIDTALKYKPDYAIALKIKKQLKDFL